jgi:hypothetical protein
MAKVDKPTDAVLQRTEPAMPFYTLSMANLFDTTQTISLNISLSIC